MATDSKKKFKTVFSNPIFELSLKFIFIGFICWNVYVFLMVRNFLTIVPIFINATLLLMVFIRVDSTKLILKSWAMIFLILGPSISIFGIFLSKYDEIDIRELLIRVTLICIGLFVYLGSNRYIGSEKINDIEIEDHLIE